MNRSIRRSAVAVVAVGVAAVLGLSACSSSSSTASAPDTTKKVTLSMVWWGDATRTAVTQKAVQGFEKLHPNITVDMQALPFDGYYDKLSTQIAANTAPDVQQMTSDFLVQYGNGGALLDLDKVSKSQLDSATTKQGAIDGKQYGVPTGISTQAIVANPVLFKAAGVALPDDKTWTWDDYEKIAKKISDSGQPGVTGSTALGTDISQIGTWFRQDGKSLFTKDGKIGFTQAELTDFFTFAKKMVTTGAAQTADEASQEPSLPIEQSSTATNKVAMGFWQTSQLTSLEAVSKDGLKLLRIPSKSGKAGGAKMAFGASQYWAASSRTKNPTEAQELIDYLANSTTAGKDLGVTRGSPANSAVRTAVLPLLSPTDKQITDFVSAITPEVVNIPLNPNGSSTMQSNLTRYTAEVLFNRQTPAEAAKNFIGETQTSISSQ
ncbi:ABC transporter substrate-binding protein [Frondihabitans cladoniiphilus]|uniref:Extracellular solute-binding protein n=1 Tax=Frondihabitans cladoniiphilus TaxID=715785 RepID=A0ABP8W6Y6_9MICO